VRYPLGLLLLAFGATAAIPSAPVHFGAVASPPRRHPGGPTWFEHPHAHWRRGLLPRRVRTSLCLCRRCWPF